VPQHDLHEFVGAVIAEIVLHHLAAAHVERLAVIQRGDHVPSRAAAGELIQRHEQARDMERFVVGGRAGGAESEPRGRHAHRHQAGDRVHLHAADAVLDGVHVIVAIAVRHRQAIIEESEMEFARLQHAPDFLIIVGRHEIGAAFRMPP